MAELGNLVVLGEVESIYVIDGLFTNGNGK